MRRLFVHQAMTDLVPVFRRERRLLGDLGLRYDQIETCAALPLEIGADSLVLWCGEDPRLPALPPDCTGLIRSTKAGAFGLAIGRTGRDTRLLISRWDEVEAAGGGDRRGKGPRASSVKSV